MKEVFKHKTFTAATLNVIGLASEIIAEYLSQGFKLTLRQLYYQFVARDLLPNTQRSYKRLGTIISNARLAGLVDWDAIEDRTRNLRQLPFWDSPADILMSVVASYRQDLWQGQKHRFEVWIEKEALVGVIERVCNELGIAYFACRGYVSQSEQYAAGKRLLSYLDEGSVTILHLGDHDPSGLDMTRDNDDRLTMFSHYLPGVAVQRIALNRDQVRQYDPPPNPAKMTDSRYYGYILEHGHSSWELDALEPAVIAQLIRDAVLPLRDDDLYQQVVDSQEHDRTILRAVRDRWSEVEDFLSEE